MYAQFQAPWRPSPSRPLPHHDPIGLHRLSRHVFGKSRFACFAIITRLRFGLPESSPGSRAACPARQSSPGSDLDFQSWTSGSELAAAGQLLPIDPLGCTSSQGAQASLRSCRHWHAVHTFQPKPRHTNSSGSCCACGAQRRN